MTANDDTRLWRHVSLPLRERDYSVTKLTLPLVFFAMAEALSPMCGRSLTP
jgi:hypothetical protein